MILKSCMKGKQGGIRGLKVNRNIDIDIDLKFDFLVDPDGHRNKLPPTRAAFVLGGLFAILFPFSLFILL